MACNENIIKNIANEITRNCHNRGVGVDSDFVTYLIELLLLNPKYGKLFAKVISRTNLEFFVNECVDMIIRGETSLNTLKMQHVMRTNYDKLQKLIDKHLESIESCLRPLVEEILEEDPESTDEAEFKKLFRKISIYIILCSGLGNPSSITTLKEGVGALESVFSLEDLRVFVALPRPEKLAQLNELMQITSGVRLFNRDCKKGGEGIPDLPFNLVDAGKACVASLSNCLIAVMQRVNSLTSAVEDCISVQEETGNIVVDVKPDSDLDIEDYKQTFALLAFNRQYEVYIRKLLADVEAMSLSGAQCVERARLVLDEIHTAVKYKAAVPVVTVFPLFTKLWQVWRAMQNVMYLVSTVNRLMYSLVSIQDQMKVPYKKIEKMLQGKQVISDQDRMNIRISTEERLSLGSLRNYIAHSDSTGSVKERHVQFLGFCALCLSVGALVPSNTKVGLINSRGARYGFCSVRMALRFSKDPQRYVNEVLEYARDQPHVVHLLDIAEELARVRHVDCLVTRILPKTKVEDRDVQTETHPIDSYIEKNYSWDLWEWKRRACQWANIVNCRTHSTQTNFSHFKSEIHCQTVEPRDKGQQTSKECGVNTVPRAAFLWGLRGRVDDGQHAMDLTMPHSPDKKKAHVISVCQWPCISPEEAAFSPKD